MTCFAKRFEKRYEQLENVLDREISSAAARLLYGIRYEERAHGLARNENAAVDAIGPPPRVARRRRVKTGELGR
jgi:hypothetical protein